MGKALEGMRGRELQQKTRFARKAGGRDTVRLDLEHRTGQGSGNGEILAKETGRIKGHVRNLWRAVSFVRGWLTAGGKLDGGGYPAKSKTAAPTKKLDGCPPENDEKMMLRAPYRNIMASVRQSRRLIAQTPDAVQSRQSESPEILGGRERRCFQTQTLEHTTLVKNGQKERLRRRKPQIKTEQAWRGSVTWAWGNTMQLESSPCSFSIRRWEETLSQYLQSPSYELFHTEVGGGKERGISPRRQWHGYMDGQNEQRANEYGAQTGYFAYR